ncbi:hypothetical protein KP005_11965 [Geomonas nitrogeniifigens]|uniref:Uncharacterized protein n=1 Tax=Geomonas diazotrophica TaxID=2843197 RepID=A0ABX8JDK7_9BACT|nr:hypothetical protein [Geomonas nitrogeniifigens]QWV96096.1 hypothetical protein KP005_11965 [Geomonas nitrogeniifigens]
MNLRTSKKQLPTWSAILDLWNSFNVPLTEIRAFNVKVYYPSLPWLDKSSDQQLIGSSNPQNDTARHLCMSICKYGTEMTILFMMVAYCREVKSRNPFEIVLHHEIKRLGLSSDFWDGNAKYVLPPLSSFSIIDKIDRAEGAWEETIKNAAIIWTEINSRWAVIRIPSFMDCKSHEYEEYRNYCDNQYELQERREFERLKKKYES